MKDFKSHFRRESDFPDCTSTPMPWNAMIPKVGAYQMYQFVVMVSCDSRGAYIKSVYLVSKQAPYHYDGWHPLWECHPVDVSGIIRDMVADYEVVATQWAQLVQRVKIYGCN